MIERGDLVILDDNVHEHEYNLLARKDDALVFCRSEERGTGTLMVFFCVATDSTVLIYRNTMKLWETGPHVYAMGPCFSDMVFLGIHGGRDVAQW